MKAEASAGEVDGASDGERDEHEVLHWREGGLKRVRPVSAVEAGAKQRPEKVEHAVGGHDEHCATLFDGVLGEQVGVLEQAVGERKQQRIEVQQRHVGVVVGHHVRAQAVHGMEV